MKPSTPMLDDGVLSHLTLTTRVGRLFKPLFHPARLSGQSILFSGFDFLPEDCCLGVLINPKFAWQKKPRRFLGVIFFKPDYYRPDVCKKDEKDKKTTAYWLFEVYGGKKSLSDARILIREINKVFPTVKVVVDCVEYKGAPIETFSSPD